MVTSIRRWGNIASASGKIITVDGEKQKIQIKLLKRIILYIEEKTYAYSITV